MTNKLVLKAVAKSHNGLEYGSGPVIIYTVEGLAEGQNLLIRNVRPRSQEGEWQIGERAAGMATKWTGAFKRAEDTLLHLQKEIDSRVCGKVWAGPSNTPQQGHHDVAWLKKAKI